MTSHLRDRLAMAMMVVMVMPMKEGARVNCAPNHWYVQQWTNWQTLMSSSGMCATQAQVLMQMTVTLVACWAALVFPQTATASLTDG